MEVVAVRIPPSARSSTCLANGHELEVGDRCIVDTDVGMQFGVVTRAVIDNPFIDETVGTFPSIVRHASRDDEEAFAHKASLEREARGYCLERIRANKLQMKLGHVDVQLDGKKMFFYFSAEGRVDFRSLVRDLVHRFPARIELRQIGSRDDAMMQGGCGTCGETLCCSTWLDGFAPVSIKMAKAQGLSLNPSKISGVCGRLMCCLKYEYVPKDGGAPRKPRSAGKARPGNSSELPKAAPTDDGAEADDARAQGGTKAPETGEEPAGGPKRRSGRGRGRRGGARRRRGRGGPKRSE